jgi:hypothetical protein
MTMDPTQTSQMLKWLDEERRKDRATIAALQERLEGQAQTLARQEEQIAALQKAVAGLEILLTRVTEFTQAVEGVRKDMALMLDKGDEQRRKEQRETERARQLEVGAIKEEIARLTEDVRLIPRLTERVDVMQAEERRLNENLQRIDAALADLGKRTEDRLQAVVYLEEQRRADHQRITSLEAEMPELRRRIETFGARLPLIEESVQKQRTRIEEGLKLIQDFARVVDELQAADFRRNQEVKKWLGQAEEARAEMERLREERQRLLIGHRDVQEALKRLEAFQERLETRQNEATEMLRVSEERIKRQWEEWQGKQEKEWRNWQVASDERWREQETKNNRLARRLESISDLLKLHQEQLDASWELRRQELVRRLKYTQDDYEAQLAEIDQRLIALREKANQEK